MRFKKWRNRPGCEGVFRLFLLNDRGRVRGGRIYHSEFKSGYIMGRAGRLVFSREFADE